MFKIFKPKTDKIKDLSILYPKVIEELETILAGRTNIYIDFSNVIFWQNKINWHIDIKRLKQFLNSFETVEKIYIYYGKLKGDDYSEKLIKKLEGYSYEVKSKPVKIMPLSIDVSSIKINSPFLLENFIKKSLLSKLNLEDIEYLNGKLKKLNDQGIKFLEQRKCNFDVEMGIDITIDSMSDIDNFILWTEDSDFEGPVRSIIEKGKKATLFMTARRVSSELSQTGVRKFEIKKIKEFICWNKELD